VHEGGVITLRVTFGGVTKTRWAVVGSARLEGGCVKSVDLGAVLGSEGRMLLHAVGMKAVDPKYRMLDTIADAIGSIILWNLHDSAQTESAKSGIVKSCRPADVRDANASVVDHATLSLVLVWAIVVDIKVRPSALSAALLDDKSAIN
jgi:hypothetical protein